jgi:hypothetical protein
MAWRCAQAPRQVSQAPIDANQRTIPVRLVLAGLYS